MVRSPHFSSKGEHRSRCARSSSVSPARLSSEPRGTPGTRKQFGRPIGSFQSVAHRLADGYLDVLGQELTLWKACRISTACLPCGGRAAR